MMIAHFNLSETDASFYFAISTIRQQSADIYLCGTIGDGSAEAWFEASAGKTLQVKILPIWDAGCDALCQRYDQEQLEQALLHALEDIHFCSELAYDRAKGCWRQQFSAVPASESRLFPPAPRVAQPHLHVCEPDLHWRRMAVC
ncbi:MAG: hypothetical protein L3J63_09275 [Geopsychrobacter sp.]|nr:hypothetical protein [Geopsychrobacter sp.]